MRSHWAHDAELEVTTSSVDLSQWDHPEDVSVTTVWAKVDPPAGPRIIYVHGTPGSSRAFGRYLVDPVDGREACSIDRPGFGSSGPEAGGAVPEYAAQVEALDHLLVERDGAWPVLVGHSLGGPIVAQAAARWPERVGAIVVLSGSLDPKLEKPRWFNYAGGIVRGALSRDMRNSNDEIMAAPKQARMLDTMVEQIVCPVAIVHGTKDKLVPIENVDYMEERFKNARDVYVDRIEKAGHFIPWNAEDRCRDAIQWAVERASESAAGAQ